MAGENYGSIGEGLTNTDESYDVNNTYYLKNSELTRKERIEKGVLSGLPIFVAALIVGTAMYLTWRIEFGGANQPGQEYPSHPSSIRSAPPSTPVVQLPASLTPVQDKESNGSSSDVLQACKQNEKCADLGLVGNCCPTNENIFLGCCSL